MAMTNKDIMFPIELKARVGKEKAVLEIQDEDELIVYEANEFFDLSERVKMNQKELDTIISGHDLGAEVLERKLSPEFQEARNGYNKCLQKIEQIRAKALEKEITDPEEQEKIAEEVAQIEQELKKYTEIVSSEDFLSQMADISKELAKGFPAVKERIIFINHEIETLKDQAVAIYLNSIDKSEYKLSRLARDQLLYYISRQEENHIDNIFFL